MIPRLSEAGDDPIRSRPRDGDGFGKLALVKTCSVERFKRRESPNEFKQAFLIDNSAHKPFTTTPRSTVV